MTFMRSINLEAVRVGLYNICLEDKFHRMVMILKTIYVVTCGQDEGSYIISKAAVFLMLQDSKD